MNAFTDSERPVLPGDPRLCTRYSVGIMLEQTALLVVLRLGRSGSDTTHAVQALTPSQAREQALHLWEAAERADRGMNAAVQIDGGKDGQ